MCTRRRSWDESVLCLAPTLQCGTFLLLQTSLTAYVYRPGRTSWFSLLQRSNMPIIQLYFWRKFFWPTPRVHIPHRQVISTKHLQQSWPWVGFTYGLGWGGSRFFTFWWIESRRKYRKYSSYRQKNNNHKTGFPKVMRKIYINSSEQVDFGHFGTGSVLILFPCFLLYSGRCPFNGCTYRLGWLDWVGSGWVDFSLFDG